MSDDTQRLARAWAERIKAAPDETYVDDVVAAAEHILATTTPPTMADVEWDDEKHHLAGAIDAEGTEVVMIGTFSGTIRVCDVDEMNETFAPWLENPGTLTPNGKRYELREVGAPEQPEHPETLVTEQDYENAPAGTVVATPHGSAWTQGPDGDCLACSRAQSRTWSYPLLKPKFQEIADSYYARLVTASEVVE